MITIRHGDTFMLVGANESDQELILVYDSESGSFKSLNSWIHWDSGCPKNGVSFAINENLLTNCSS